MQKPNKILRTNWRTVKTKETTLKVRFFTSYQPMNAFNVLHIHMTVGKSYSNDRIHIIVSLTHITLYVIISFDAFLTNLYQTFLSNEISVCTRNICFAAESLVFVSFVLFERKNKTTDLLLFVYLVFFFIFFFYNSPSIK